MKKRFILPEEERHLFYQSVKGVKKLQQDTVVHAKASKHLQHVAVKKQLQEQIELSCFYFSDEFHPQLAQEGPTRYLRPDVSPYELKKLRRGDYIPDLFLDLHGLTQQQAKQELAALLVACRKEHVLCACVMHGHGKQILKQQTPLWLAQHPDVMAFHQAPKEWGGNAALLILVEQPEKQHELSFTP